MILSEWRPASSNLIMKIDPLPRIDQLYARRKLTDITPLFMDDGIDNKLHRLRSRRKAAILRASQLIRRIDNAEGAA